MTFLQWYYRTSPNEDIALGDIIFFFTPTCFMLWRSITMLEGDPESWQESDYSLWKDGKLLLRLAEQQWRGDYNLLRLVCEAVFGETAFYDNYATYSEDIPAYQQKEEIE